MTRNAGRGIRQGRPFGGIAILIRRDLLHGFKCLARMERFICVMLCNTLIVNVYLPVNTGNKEYAEQLECTLQSISSVIMNENTHNVIIGGDFNCDFNRRCTGQKILTDFMESLDLTLCDTLVDEEYVDTVLTYHCPNGQGGSFIDHFCVSRSIFANVDCCNIIESGINLSDHSPIYIKIHLSGDLTSSIPKKSSSNRRLRWDRADLAAYHSNTYRQLANISPPNNVQYCCVDCKCVSAQSTVDELYGVIVEALTCSANKYVPRTKSGYFKHWWNGTLSELKQASIEAHNLWKACGRPKQGDIFLNMKQVKLSYKNAIRAYKQNEELFLSNELHELLLEKDMVNFWRTWNSKVVKPNLPAVIDGETEVGAIAEKFAKYFKSSCDSRTSVNNHTSCDGFMKVSSLGSKCHADMAILAHKMIDVELVRQCMSQMKRCRAAGADGIEAEHLLHAHPILIVQLCILFNIMLKHSIVPQMFCNGIIVPIAKDKQGDLTDINNYRAITLSPCISKLFEMCLQELYSSCFVTSSLQFGFKKKLGCTHAIYVLQSVIEYFTSRGSTVNVALLDLSKAFDRVDHSILHDKLIDAGLPSNVVQLISSWYMNSWACVRWGSGMSRSFQLTTGVRQGGVLSPVFFTLYVDILLRSLQSAELGCIIGNQYLGCVMYADDLVLMSISVTEMQEMIDRCVTELVKLKMVLNPSKCSVLRFGCGYNHNCTSVKILDQPIPFVLSAKYLGIKIQSARRLLVDINHMKKRFYATFNGIFHRVKNMRDELTTLHLVSTYCKPYLLYATECLNLSVTQIRSLCHTWQCAVSHVFNVSGKDVSFICFATDNELEQALSKRRTRFYCQLKQNVDNDALVYLYSMFADGK